VLLLASLLVGCKPEPASQSLNVVVLVLDGARFDETFALEPSSLTGAPPEQLLPRIHGTLLPQGTLVRPGYAHGLTITAPGHCDLLTAHRQSFVNYANPDTPGAYLPNLPTLFESLRQSAALDSSGVILLGNSSLVEPLRQSLYPDTPGGAAFYLNEEDAASDTAILKRARALLTEFHPRLLVANLHEIDRSGHYGTASGYLENLSDADDGIMELWEALWELDGYADRTVLVLVSDHGRHRIAGEEEAWVGHGDHCGGCREVGMFLVGPGIRQGAVSTTPYALEDLGHTLAVLLDTPMPYSQGIVMTDVLTDPPAERAVTGEVRPAVDGALVAVEERTGEVATRSRIRVEGLEVADTTAAEAPSVASGPSGDYVCWRELTVTPGADWMPWEGRCFARLPGADWADIGFPAEPVWPLLAPDLVADDAGLWMVFVDNPGGLIEVAAEVRLMRWTATEGWVEQGPAYIQASVPTEPVLLLSDDGPIVALAGSDDGDDGRNTRRIEVIRLAGESWEALLSVRPEDLGVGRLEKPALWQDAEARRLAFLSHTDAPQSSIWMVTLTDDSASGAVRLDETDRVLGHLAPRFTADGQAVWARVGLSGNIEVCRSAGEAPTCLDTDAPYIDGLALTDGGVVVSIRDDDSAWAQAEIPW
jgi:hypothetical protein